VFFFAIVFIFFGHFFSLPERVLVSASQSIIIG
jgi:hypothetical protein